MCHYRTKVDSIFLSTNSSNEVYEKFGVTEVFKGQDSMKFMRSLVWKDDIVIKKSEATKLGDAPVGYPSIFQEYSSI